MLAMRRDDGVHKPPATQRRSRPVPPAVRAFLVVFAAYLAGAVASALAFGSTRASAFFVPGGITVAALLLTRRSLWPVIVAAISVLVVGTSILLWRKQSDMIRSRPVETVAILAAAAGLSFVGFATPIPPGTTVLPILAVAALRLGVLGTALTGVVVAAIGNYLTGSNLGLLGETDTARAMVLHAALHPPHAHTADGIDYCVCYEPADTVHGLGGDWYDVMSLPGNRTYLAVGDVVGHGLPAVEDMAQLRGAARTLAHRGQSPAHVLTDLNVFTDDVLRSQFATVVLAVVDHSAGTLTYSSAGHPPAFLRRAATGQVVRLGFG